MTNQPKFKPKNTGVLGHNVFLKVCFIASVVSNLTFHNSFVFILYICHDRLNLLKVLLKVLFSFCSYLSSLTKGPVTGYGKLTWEFAHAWNFMKLCALIVLVMTAIIMVYSLINSIPLANYDVIYDVTTIAKGTPL